MMQIARNASDVGSHGESPPNGNWAEPFCAAVSAVFDQMIGADVVLQEATVSDSLAVLSDITAVIGLSGKTTGLVALTVPKLTALGVAEVLLGEPHSSLDEPVIDALGELLNVIAGAAKARLQPNQPSLGLPSVVIGPNNKIAFPSKARPTQLQFRSPLGEFVLHIALEAE